MVDVGCGATEKVDYPDIAVAVCRKVVSGDCERGIILDGAGIGSCIAANKMQGDSGGAVLRHPHGDQQPGAQQRERADAWGGRCTMRGSCARWRARGCRRASAAGGTWCG